MKVRTGFVSNSSSTSFTCSACSENVIGRDMSMKEAGMIRCENGHTLCEYKCVKKNWDEEITEEIILKYVEEELPIVKKREEEYAEEYGTRTDEQIRKDLRSDFEYEYREKAPSKYCPVCSFDVISEKDYMSFLLYKLGMKYKDIKDEIRKEFNSYEELKEKIKEH